MTGAEKPRFARGDAAPRVMRMHELVARVGDQLVEMLIIAGRIRTAVEQEEAPPLGGMVPEIDRVIGRIEKLLKHLNS